MYIRQLPSDQYQKVTLVSFFTPVLAGAFYMRFSRQIPIQRGSLVLKSTTRYSELHAYRCRSRGPTHLLPRIILQYKWICYESLQTNDRFFLYVRRYTIFLTRLRWRRRRRRRLRLRPQQSSKVKHVLTGQRDTTHERISRHRVDKVCALNSSRSRIRGMLWHEVSKPNFNNVITIIMLSLE